MSNLTVVASQYAWEHKYRPDNIDEIIMPRDVKAKLHGYLVEGKGKIPSLLFYSPKPGTGKTTTALALCNEIGCKKPLFINASLQNSIEVVRDLVIQYSTGVSVFGGQKVVILDEVERLSPAAQESLKGVVEQVAANCSFILTTNAKQRINEALRSRCREIDFVWNEKEALEVQVHFMKRCLEITTAEGIQCDPKVLSVIVKKNFPDNRKIMGILQENATTFGVVDERALRQVLSSDLQVLVAYMKEKNWGDVKQWVSDNQSSITEDFYSQVFKAIVPQTKEKPKLISDEKIPELVFICGDAQINHRNVGDLWLHALYFLTNLMMSMDNGWK